MTAYQVYSIKSTVALNAEVINTTQSIEDVVHNLLEKLDEGNLSSKTINIVINELNESIEAIPPIKTEFPRINGSDSLSLKQELSQLDEICRRVVVDYNKSSRLDSASLDNYWKLTISLLIVSCLIALSMGRLLLYSLKARKLLLNEKAKSDQLLNKSVDIIISCDNQSIITEFNQAAEQAFGYKRADILGRNISEITLGHKEEVEKELRKKGVFKGEVINRRKDGRFFLSFLSANLLYDDEENIIGSMGISRDISQQKEQDQQYSNIVKNASHVIYNVDFEGKCTFVNKKVTEYFGYEVEEVIGKSFLEFVYEEDVELVGQFYGKQLKNNINETTLEFRGKTKDGSYKWVSQDVNVIYSTVDSKKITGFQGVVRVIDETKIAEKKLEEAEIKYSELFNNSTDLIHSIDMDGKFIYVNKTWLKKLKYTEEDLKSLNLFDIIHPASQDHYMNLINEVKNNQVGESEFVSYKVISKDHQIITLEGGITFTKENGQIRTIQSFLRDVTIEKESQETITRHNEDLTSSLAYAKSIQESVLPKLEDVKSIYPDSFLIYYPRDLVSGDFYIADYITTNDLVKLPVLLVGDCTGHGVPGAILSLMCNALVKESFIKREVNRPSEAFEFIRKKMIKLFQSGGRRLTLDGMDAAFCVFNLEKGEMYFAGAHLSCLIIREGQIIEIKGDRQHVGYNHNSLSFTDHTVPIKKGDAIFISSDGYSDQFGGPNNKKFMKKRFYNLLLENSNLSMEELGVVVEENFKLWKGSNEQIDDVTVVGIRI